MHGRSLSNTVLYSRSQCGASCIDLIAVLVGEFTLDELISVLVN